MEEQRLSFEVMLSYLVEKQDSETAAARRWIIAHHDLVGPGHLTVLGDDLYSRQPMCQTCIDPQVNFIVVALPTSHPALYEWLAYLDANDAVHRHQERVWTGRTNAGSTARSTAFLCGMSNPPC